MYTCPVCFYDRLRHPPDDYIICPSCGTEFGYTDFNVSHALLRDRWIMEGLQWHSRVIQPPAGWSGREQLRRAGHLADIYSTSHRGEVRFPIANVYFVAA
jgi:hypothetical protein